LKFIVDAMGLIGDLLVSSCAANAMGMRSSYFLQNC
jgi:hypothetical protein